MNSSWERMFPDRILARGFDYYLSGRVLNVEQDDDRYKAVVQGSENYNVEVEFDGDEIIDMDCDCPYAEDGDYCKHEAALLCYLESTNARDNKPDTPSEEIKRIIDTLDEETLRELLYSAVMSNHELLDKLMKKVPQASSTKPSFSALYYRASEFIETMEDEDCYFSRDDFDDSVSDAIYGLDMFLTESVLPLVEQKEYCFDVFKLVSDILDDIPYSTLFDYGYDGCVDDLDTTIVDIMDKAYINAENKDDIESLARERAQKRSITSQYYQDFLILTVKDKTLAREALDELRTNSSHGPFLYPIDDEIDLMEVLEYSEEEIREVLRSHLDLRMAQKMLVERLLENDEWKSCIEIIKEISATYGKNDDCYNILKKIYREHGMDQELGDLIYSDIMSVDQFRMDGIDELRELLTEEDWREKCNTLKTASTMKPIMAKFLNSIQDYPALMSWFEESVGSYNLEYGPLLLTIYPDRTIAAYEKLLRKEHLHDRKSYQYHATKLQDLVAVAEGRKFVISYVQELLNEYPNRPALKDEMQKMLKRNKLL